MLKDSKELNLNDLINRQKVLDKGDHMIMEYFELDGIKYFSNGTSSWPCFQFDLSTFEIYNGDLEVGEFLN